MMTACTHGALYCRNKSVETEDILWKYIPNYGTSMTEEICHYTFKTTSIKMCKTLVDKNQLDQRDECHMLQ